MSTLELKELSHPAGEVIKIAAGKTLDLKSQGSVTMPTGSVLQVKQAVLTSTISISSPANETWQVLTGLEVSITPKSTASKFLVSFSVAVDTNNNYPIGLHIYRDSTKATPDGPVIEGLSSFITHQQSADTRDLGVQQNGSFLDSPNTASTVVYKIFGAKPAASTSVLNINTLGGTSSITVQEIQG